MSQRLENISTQMEIILSAIYMATSHISDEQIIKQSLRSAALQVMADTIELVGDNIITPTSSAEVQYTATPDYRNTDKLKSNIKVNIYKSMSFIKVLRSERMMTDKNADLLIMTYSKLLAFINDYQSINLYLVSDNIKDIDYSLYTDTSDSNDSNNFLFLNKNINKANTGNIKNFTNTNLNINKVNQIYKSKELDIGIKLNRENYILSILKRATHTSQDATQGMSAEGYSMSEILTDIRSIDDAELKAISEKTVQRELNSMIMNGLIIKKGEKRWSRYILPPVLL